VTFNVGLVCQANSSGLILPSLCRAVRRQQAQSWQAVTGFMDREGGSFFQEWSALFVMEGVRGENLLPLSAVADDGKLRRSDDSAGRKRQGSQARVLLMGQFMAMPVTDPLDGSTWCVIGASCLRSTRWCEEVRK